jgi:hypothetical protein
MATKHGGLLADLGKRLLGFNTFSSCCAAPTAEAKAPATKPIEIVTPANAAPRTSRCRTEADDCADRSADATLTGFRGCNGISLDTQAQPTPRKWQICDDSGHPGI